MPAVDRGDALALTRALVSIDSRNPLLVPGAPGESEAAGFLASVLSDWGFRVETIEAAPNRPNVIARIGTPGGKSLMFNGHLDVVGVEGMSHPPFDPVIRNGKLYGRGSTDMKAGIAAMCAAALAAADAGIAGEIVIAAVADEEFESLGTRALIASGVRTDACVIAEPTRLAICPAHRGFAWFDIAIAGRAAHGSRYDLGVDAIAHAGLLLSELDRLEHEILPKKTHALLGRPSIHASLISGGSGYSTYPDRCKLGVERRTIPGETALEALSEIELLCEGIRTRRQNFEAMITLGASQPPSDVRVDAPIVIALETACLARGYRAPIEGLSAWTDAALLNEAGMPSVCFGPGDISLAHSAEEFVEVREIEQATAILRDLAINWLSE
ncbi:MAG: ArgE/DapE family deacylase [Gemmatimonadaceae bacterium]|nr:ArgE/DapE family deacylase [Gemmatimonadaceae bacterium]